MERLRWVKNMSTLKDSRLQKIAELRCELASLARRCDEIEKRHQVKEGVADLADYHSTENSEIRLASCVASGMSKAKISALSG